MHTRTCACIYSRTHVKIVAPWPENGPKGVRQTSYNELYKNALMLVQFNDTHYMLALLPYFYIYIFF